jgi:hypothetical protein
LLHSFVGEGLGCGSKVANFLGEDIPLPHEDELEEGGPKFVLVPGEKFVDICSVIDSCAGKSLWDLWVLFAKVDEDGVALAELKVSIHQKRYVGKRIQLKKII